MSETQKLICVNCSSNDEQHNSKMFDIELISLSEKFFDNDDAEFEVWQCPRCMYKLWIRTNLNNT